jgi:hypothetical protein
MFFFFATAWAKAQLYKPGKKVRVSGIYVQVEPSGRVTDRKATLVKGEPFPPTKDDGYRWMLHRPTKGR